MKIQDFDVVISLNDTAILSGNSGVGFHELTIVEDIETILPTCTISFICDEFFLKDNPIVDGSKLQIDIFNSSKQVKESYKFRVFNTKIEIQNNVIIYNIYGYFDIYGMYSDAYKYVLFGNSSEVFNNIAAQLKLKTDIDNTKDKQLWSASNLNVVQWLSNIANHGYIGDTSCMIWAVDRNCKLLYKDLSNIITRARNSSLYNLSVGMNNKLKSAKDIIYATASPVFDSGVENLSKRGYGGSDYYFDFKTYAIKEAVSKKAVASSNIINVNKDLAASASRNYYKGFNFGNHHENYYQAEIQNQRLASLFSTYFNINLRDWFNFSLLQPINFKYRSDNVAASDIEALSGIYVINKIISRYTLNSIQQEIQIMGQGYNTVKSTTTF